MGLLVQEPKYSAKGSLYYGDIYSLHITKSPEVGMVRVGSADEP